MCVTCKFVYVDSSSLTPCLGWGGVGEGWGAGSGEFWGKKVWWESEGRWGREESEEEGRGLRVREGREVGKRRWGWRRDGKRGR